jgi:pimeloyl-ACP methyl ester carboxylesterase
MATPLDLAALGGEITALARMAVSLPARLFASCDALDPAVRAPLPVLLVHGLCGDPSNFQSLRHGLEMRGFRNVASFSYLPRLDHQELAAQLDRRIAAVCAAADAPALDVVAHSFGGFIARYLVELTGALQVRRLVTLGGLYYSNRRPSRELAIFGAADPVIVPPRPSTSSRERVLVVPHCGHFGLLTHPAVLRAVIEHLERPSVRPLERPVAATRARRGRPLQATSYRRASSM